MRVIQPDPTDILPFTAYEETLANGLRVLVVPTGFPHLVSLQIPVQTGSRNEVEEGKSGFAHFFEHMMFRGTPRFPSEAYSAVVTRAGARQNAYTTDDFTNYHITFAKEDLEQILEIEADRFMNLRYSEADFRTEARAILGEYNKSAADPLVKLIEVQRENAYRVHTYRHTTMGFLRDIEAMPEQYEYSRTFFERWYRPQFTTVILAGDVEPGPAIALVERHFGGWRAGATPEVVIPAEPEPEAAVVAHVPWPTPTLPWVTVGFHGPAFSATTKEFAALDILFDLFFGETSDAYQELVEQRQVVDQFFPWAGGQQDPGLFTVLARVKRAEDAPSVRDRILQAVGEARARPVDGTRLEEAKANARYSFARTLDNSESVAATLARFVRYERRYETLNELYRQYAALTPEDLHGAALRYLAAHRMVVTTLAHGDLPPQMSEVPAIPESEPLIEAPRFELIEQPSPSTLLRFKLLFRAGSAHDPAGKEGLAELAAAMVAEAGSQRMRIDEINRALFPMAGTFGAQVDREMTTFTGVIHRDNVDRFLDIVLPQLTAPGMRDEDFRRLRDQQLNDLTVNLRSNNEEELGKERLQALIFAGTPYAHPPQGTEAGIAATGLEDVGAWHAARYTQSNLIAGLTGNWPERARARLLDALGGLPAGPRSEEVQVAARGLRGIEVEIIQKETRSVAISFGHPLRVTRAHPDFPALWLARSWLGEHRTSSGRLFQRLREVRGLNYGDYAYIEAFPRGMWQFFPEPNLGRRAQLFEIWIRPVEPRHAVFALKAALYELRKLIAGGLTQEQFEETQAYLLKNVYVSTKTQDQQLGAALDSRWYGMGDYVETMRAGVAALTVERVNAAVREHLSGDDLQVVMVATDAPGLRDELLNGGFTAIEYGSPKPEEVLAEDREIGAIDLGVTSERVRITPVDEVFAR
jgi:zinc protease